MQWARFNQTVHIEGRYFADGALVQVVPADAVVIVLPSLEASTCTCTVPAYAVDLVVEFDAVVVNREYRVSAEIVIYGTCAEDARQRFVARNPACEVVDITNREPSARVTNGGDHGIH